MKIVITGSLGNISKPLAEELLQNDHQVTIISSSANRQEEIKKLGAEAAIGSLEDPAFLTRAFTGADAVYCMVPPNNYFDRDLNLREYYRRLGNNYVEAITGSGVKRVVNLSTIGGHLDKGNGILVGAHDVATMLDALPDEVSVTHMRPTSFYYNLLGYIPMIKSQGVIMANYGEEDIVPWVSPIDIAISIADEITNSFTGRKIRYVASEEVSCSETATVLGAAIGKPDLKWIRISDQESLDGLVGIGMSPTIAAGLVEMYSALHTGLLAEDYYKHRPAVMGKVKLKDYAKEFADAYNKIS
ncbi:MAG: NAD(P)H-binding protein [Bacteroidota bacterium]